MKHFIILAILGLFPAPAWAGNWADNPDYANDKDFAKSRALCAALRKVDLPPVDRPDRRKEGGMADCRSDELYYGIGMKADEKAAYRCAQLEEADTMWGGDMMLATIYANGMGAPRDLDKAIALACRTGWAPAEFHGRVRHLDDMRRSGANVGEFHWCDDITSGYMGGWCSDLAARQNQAERKVKFAAFQQRWSQGEPAAKLRALLDAAESFASMREAEVDKTGTLRGAMVLDAEEEIRDLLVRDLNAVVGLDPKLALAATDTQADAELNRIYKRVMAYEFGTIGGEPTPDGIRKVQRAWLKYRDAWLAFVKVARPEISSQAMTNWQTRHRIAQLKGVIGED